MRNKERKKEYDVKLRMAHGISERWAQQRNKRACGWVIQVSFFFLYINFRILARYYYYYYYFKEKAITIKKREEKKKEVQQAKNMEPPHSNGVATFHLIKSCDALRVALSFGQFKSSIFVGPFQTHQSTIFRLMGPTIPFRYIPAVE